MAKTRKRCSIRDCNIIPVDGISFHKFPKNYRMKIKWCKACKLDKERLTPFTGICSNHFNNEDYYPRNKEKRRKLKSNVIPSKNLPQEYYLPSKDYGKRKVNGTGEKRTGKIIKPYINSSCDNNSSNNNICQINNVITNSMSNGNSRQVKGDHHSIHVNNYVYNNTHSSFVDVKKADNKHHVGIEHGYVVKNADCSSVELNNDCQIDESSAALVLAELEGFQTCNDIKKKIIFDKCVQVCTSIITNQRKTLLNIIETDNELFTFTGIDFSRLNNLVQAYCNVDGASTNVIEFIQDKIVLTLCKLKIGFSFLCLSVLFDINECISNKWFNNTLPILATILKQFIYWPGREEILISINLNSLTLNTNE